MNSSSFFKRLLLYVGVPILLIFGTRCTQIGEQQDSVPLPTATSSVPGQTALTTATPPPEASEALTATEAPVDNCEKTIPTNDDHSVYLIHTPPIILQDNETAHLGFIPLCSNPSSVACHPRATLYASWGNDDFIEYNHIDSIDLAATNPKGQPLRYYVELENTDTGTTGRYPRAGCIEPIVVSSFLPIKVSRPEKSNAQTIIHLLWGTGANQVGLRPGSEGPTFGPPAFDAGPDGTIGIIDSVNERILLYDPANQEFSKFPLLEMGAQDIDIDAQGRIAILQRTDMTSSGIGANVLLFNAKGQLLTNASVYADLPDMFVENLAVLDDSDYRLVFPVDDKGQARTQEEQQSSRAKPQLAFQGVDATHIRLADAVNGLFFELISEVELGGVVAFEHISQGYVIVFQDSNEARVIWFDPSGNVLGDRSALAPLGEWFHPGSSVAIEQDGGVYIFGSAGDGVKVVYVKAP